MCCVFMSKTLAKKKKEEKEHQEQTCCINRNTTVDAIKDHKGFVVLCAEVDHVVAARVDGTEVRTALDKVVQAQHAPGQRGPVQRCLAVLRAGREAGAARHKKLGNLQVPVVHRPVQWRGCVCIPPIHLFHGMCYSVCL